MMHRVARSGQYAGRLLRPRHPAGALLLAFVLLAGCTAPDRAAPGPAAVERPRATAPVRVTAVMMSDPTSLNNDVNRATAQFVIAGGPELQLLVSAGLSVLDDRGQLHPQLADAAPTVENGLWRVEPDGQMETTWRIREGARWQDGTPFTADDLVFTHRLLQDKDLEVFRNVAYDAIASVEARDPRTVTVRWNKSYIHASQLFSPELGVPLPRHLLEREYDENRRNVLYHPYWGNEFVGTGPFRLREFVRGSHISLEANGDYVLGRPKIDEIDVRLIPDPNTVVANILSGAVELTIGRNVSLEQAVQLREQWVGGKVLIAPASWIVIYPQFFNPTPTVVADVRLRRALLHAIDRPQMVETLQAGLTPIAHAFLAPDEPEYPDVEANIVRYDYDPQRAAQIIEGMGYSRGVDGMFRDANNQRLSVEIRAITGIDINQKALFSVADYWQRIGVGVDTVVVPRARTSDREYIATFPAFQVNRQGSTVSFLTNRVSRAAPTAETNFVGGNYSRYMDSGFDAMIERFFVTVPRQARMEILGDLLRQLTDQVLTLGLFFDGTPALIGRRIDGVTPRQEGWNAHTWTVAR
jgi:peptide/nickel transport system substrate-binding protein